MLIDSTYFRNIVKLPIGEYSDIDQYIEQYEKEVLINLLGYDQYTEMMVAYNASIAEVDPVALPAKWENLINGMTYTYSDRSIHWNGLINSDKISFIANYVFCKYLKEHQTAMSGAGATQPKNENSVVVDGVAKYADAWNNFVKLYGYIGQDCYEPSCLNFLIANEADYAELYPKIYGFTNQFGI